MLMCWTIVIWIQLDCLSKVMNLLGHLNWDEFMSFDSWAKASKMPMGHFVLRPFVVWSYLTKLSQSINLLGLFNWDKFTPRDGLVEYSKNDEPLECFYNVLCCITYTDT